MPWGLKRYYGRGSLHFITWSCYRRQPLLGTPARRDLVLTVLERMRVRYRFAVIGYVVMPEHVHLVISEPLISEPMISEPMTGDPSKIIQAVKLSVSRRLAIAGEFSGRLWQSRFYDFNLWGQQKEAEKLNYMHRNPVVRGLVASPEDWREADERRQHPSRFRSVKDLDGAVELFGDRRRHLRRTSKREWLDTTGEFYSPVSIQSGMLPKLDLIVVWSFDPRAQKRKA